MNPVKYTLIAIWSWLAVGLAWAQPYSVMPAVQPDTAVVKYRWSLSRQLSRDALPPSVDNSCSPYFPPIISQKGGSCAQASGIGYMFTYEMNRWLNRNASATDANTFSYLFTWNFLNDGEDVGGFVDQGLTIAIQYGVMTEADYGYASAYQFKWASGYDKYLRAMQYRGKRLLEFQLKTEDDLLLVKQYLSQKNDGKTGGGILTFSTMSTHWQINDHYDGPSLTGYHSLLTALGNDGAHALTIAGYDDTVTYTDDLGETHKGAFIVVNSWGDAFHDRARYYLPYYFFLHRGPGISESILSSTLTGVEARTHQPQLVMKIGLEYSSRNDLSFIYGASNTAESGYPEDRFSPPIMLNQGGDHAMGGAYGGEKEFEFAIDYTEHLQSAQELKPKYFLNIRRYERGNKTGEGKLTHFSLIDYRQGNTPVEYVCKEVGDRKLQLGDNLFSIATRPELTVSANSIKWLSHDQINPDCTYVVRTANGKFAKLRFVGHDPKTGKVTIQYLYQPDGTRNLLTE